MVTARNIEVGGQVLRIAPVTIGRLPEFLAAVKPVARELAEGDILDALARNADSVINAITIGAGCDRDWLDEQEPDALVALGSAVIEVNADFFVERLLPALEAATRRVNALLDQAGGEPGL